jgi:two-component SAPR family response regulator
LSTDPSSNGSWPEPLVALETDLQTELLPGWYDDWVLVERERLRQLQLHALDALARRLLDSGRVAEAVDAASCSLGMEPLRESAVRLLVSAHLASGNVCEAQRIVERYRVNIRRELGVAPSNFLIALLQSEI